MQKSEDKIIALKELFLEGKSLSINDICETLDIKRARAYDYICVLSEEGFIFTKTVQNRTAYYTLSSEVPETSLYKPISQKEILKYKILYVLRNKPLNVQELHKDLVSDFPGLIHLSSLYTLVDEMIQEGLLIGIYRDKKSVRRERLYKEQYLYPSGLNVSLILNVDVEGQTIINTYLASGQHQSEALYSLSQKIAILAGDNTQYDYDDSIFFQYGRGYHIDSKIQDYYKILMNNHFQTNIISFKYNGKPIKFASGLVVYSQDKDMLYLVGRKLRTHNTSILKLTNITDIEETSDTNNEYGLEKYNSYLRNMFSIATEDPVDVEVHFKKNEDNYIKLYRLSKLRVNCSIEVTDEKIIYKDCISGISDFANYLRGYGYDFDIIKPNSLKESVHNTITRSLSRYRNTME